jgi:hypothetical protein
LVYWFIPITGCLLTMPITDSDSVVLHACGLSSSSFGGWYPRMNISLTGLMGADDSYINESVGGRYPRMNMAEASSCPAPANGTSLATASNWGCSPISTCMYFGSPSTRDDCHVIHVPLLMRPSKCISGGRESSTYGSTNTPLQMMFSIQTRIVPTCPRLCRHETLWNCPKYRSMRSGGCARP